MREKIRFILTLTIICFFTAILLSGAYFLTKPRIIQQKENAQNIALQEVFPGAGCFEPVMQDGEIICFKAYKSTDKKIFLGYAFKSQGEGYSSIIETMSGMDPSGRITSIKVLAQNETPGLGAKISEVLVEKTLWQAIQDLFSGKKEREIQESGSWFCSQFEGKNVRDLIVVKTPTEKNIQAVTGATISSEALTNSVRKKAEQISSYMGLKFK